MLFGRYFTDSSIDSPLFFKIATASAGVVCINAFFIYATAFAVFKFRSGSTRFLYKKQSRDRFKKLDEKRKDSVMSATMGDEVRVFGGGRRGERDGGEGGDGRKSF